MPGGEKIPIPEFAAKIKEKYPEYKDVNDTLLTQKITEKYPEYKDMVDYQPAPTETNGSDNFPKESVADKLLGKVNNQPTAGDTYAVNDTEKRDKALAVRNEAIDNTIAKKNKGFTVSKTGLKAQTDALTQLHDNGDLAVAKDKDGKPVLKKSTGFLASAIDAINQSAIDKADNENLLNLDTQGKIDYLKAKALDENNSVPSGAAGAAGNFIGENADILAKGTVGALTGGTLAPEIIGASNFGSFVSMVNDFAKGGAGNLVQKTFADLKQQNPQMSDYEAMQKAEQTAPLGAATGIATGALLSGMPKVPLLEASTPAAQGFLKGIAKSASKLMSYEVPKMAVVSGAEALANSLGEMGAGVNKTPGEVLSDVGESAAHGAVIGAAFYAMQHPLKVLSYLRPQAENVVASIPKEQRTKLLETAQANGVVSKEEASSIDIKAEEFAKAKQPFDGLPIAEENKAALTGKALQKQKLVDEKNNLAKHGDAFLPRIEELDGQIADIEKQMATMYNAKDVFAKEKDSVTGEKLNDVNQEQAATDLKEANDLGFEHPVEAINSVNKHTDSDYSSFQDIPKEVLQQVSEQRKINQDAVPIGRTEAVLPRQQEETGSSGSERSGVGSGQQGDELAGESTPVKENGTQNGEAQPLKEFTSKQGHKLTVADGSIKVVSKDGKELSRPTRKKVIREAAESYDFTQGKQAPEPDFVPANDEEFKKHVVEKTTSPSELAEVYINEQPEKAGLSTKEQMIADYGMGKVTEDSYRSHGDRNNQNHNKARAYFSNDGTPIDSLAKEIGDHYGVDITPQDVVDFIDRFPNGADAALAERENNIALSAKDRFSELTGLPLDREIAEIAIKQQFKKLSQQEQDLIKQDYETRQQLEDEYWKHFETNGSTEDGINTETQQAAGVETDKPETVTELAGASIPIVNEFVEHDVAPRLNKIGGSFKSALRLIVNTLSPKTGVSEKAITHLMTALGSRNEASMQVDKALHSFEKMFDKMNDADRIAFIDKMKRGEQQPTSELDGIATAIKELDKNLYDEITKYKPDMDWKENHFRVLWKVIPGSVKGKEKIWSALTRRPFQGSKGFMKQATLIDMSEGIAKGGVPESTNPVRMFKLAYADGMKYVSAQRMFEALKGDKMVKFVKMGDNAPDGFVQLNDRLAKVYFKAPQGLVTTGEYWIEEGAGRLLNNHLSVDVFRQKGTALGEAGSGLMEIKNLFTQFELGLSAFHAIAESMEAVSSTLGIGIRKLVNLGFRGDLRSAIEGVKDIITSPLAPGLTFKTGRGAIRFASEKEFAASDFGKNFLKKVPDAEQYVHDFFTGGGLMKQHTDLQSTTLSALKEHAGKNNYIGSALRALPALNETIMSPLFNYYIPALKVGMFFREFPVTLKENKARLDKGQITREELSRKTVDFIDDRLGEMNFDNLFWNRSFKTATQFMMRSVTWKMGNLRAMAGAPIEQAFEFYNAARENRAPILMPKMAWLFGLSAMQVVLAATIQHMLTGKPLKDLKDVVAPQINKDDETERVVMPTYYKDMLHLWHSPGGYITTSSSGPISKMMDIWNNKDFYNYEIHDEHDGWLQKRKDDLRYFIPKPFSITSATQMINNNEPASKVAMSFFGLNKAPGYLTHTEIENKIFDLHNLRSVSVKPKSEKEGADAKREIKRLYKEGKRKEAENLANSSIEKGVLRHSQTKYLFKNVNNHNNASIYFFRELPFADKEYLFKQMTDEEKKLYDPRGTLAKQIK